MTSFEQLEFQHGPLRFSALAAGSGPVVLCLHGFPDNARSYRLQLPALANAGYRAISVHLRGYEPGSIPADGDYSSRALTGDVVSIIDQLGEDKVHLVGHDWGAIHGYRIAAFVPDRIKSLTAMTIPHIGRLLAEMRKHPKQLALSWYVFFFQLRGISERVVARKDYSFIRMLWRRWCPGWEPPEDELQAVITTLSQPGVIRAALGHYREVLGPQAIPLSKAATKAAIFKIPVPTLAIIGEVDGCVSSDFSKATLFEEDFPKGLTVRQIADAGHFPHQQKPDDVNALLLQWLAQYEKQSPGV
jgi:pimeloyl-ACP methyl ester carboxylesterase